jgi:hypothetical protein
MSSDGEVTFRPWHSVPLTAGLRPMGRFAMVDEADYELVSAYRWGVTEGVRRSGSTCGPYAVVHVRGSDGKRLWIGMHRLITGWPQTDHINRYGLDNRRDNLRPATTTENSRNRGPIYGGHSSRFKGVIWRKRERKWQARIGVAGVQRNLGLYVDEKAAALAYDAAAREFFGEFAYLNSPSEDTPAGPVPPLTKREEERDEEQMFERELVNAGSVAEALRLLRDRQRARMTGTTA